MARSAAVRVPLRRTLDVDGAERIIRSLNAIRSPTRLRLDLSDSRVILPGAGWRLGNALRPFGSDARLDVIVPDDLRSNRLAATVASYRRSGLGAAIAVRARQVRTTNGKIITAWFREAFSPLTVNKEGHVVVPSLQNAGIAEDESRFADQFNGWLATLHKSQHERIDAGDIANLSKLTLEAVNNVRDHASREPLHADVQVVSMLALSYFDGKRFIDAAVPEDFAAYVERLRDKRVSQSLLGYLEILVADDGVGIAARQSQALDVYVGDTQAEDRYLSEALEAGQSIKLRTRDAPVRGDPGYGFTHIAATLRRLQAYAVLRTGRRRLTFDGTSDDGNYVPLDAILSYMPGTVVHLLVPIREAQMSLPSTAAG